MNPDQQPAVQHAPQNHWFESEPLWFKTAVFYEIRLRGFFDGNGDGSGDWRVRFPRIGELPYLLTLAPRGFFWFVLQPPTENELEESPHGHR